MATKPSKILIPLLFFAIQAVQSRLISLNTSSQLVDDGLLDHYNQYQQPLFNDSSSLSRSTCNHAYGFIPCADNVGGYVFQIILFQYLLFRGSKLVRDGSKKLFTMVGTGVFGASLFGVLLAFPEIIFVVISGVFTTKGGAKQMVSLGVAVYAGSIVFCLTLIWGMCVIVAREDLDNNNTDTRMNNSLDDPSYSYQCLPLKRIFLQLKGTGVHTDNETRHTAGIMLLSLIPYGILQTIFIFNTSSSGSRTIVLVALVVSSSLLLSYFIYQVMYPWIQERSLQYNKRQSLVKEFVKYALKHTEGNLIDENGQPNVQAIERLFHQIDKNADNNISVEEWQSLVHELEPEKDEGDVEYSEKQIIEALQLPRHGRINIKEFIQGIMNLLRKAKEPTADTIARGFLRKVIKPFIQARTMATTSEHSTFESNREEMDKELFEVQHDGSMHQRLSMAWAYTKHLAKIIFGILVITFIGDPFMDSIVDLSDSMGISTFLISFIIVPIIMNAKKAISAIVSARKMNKKTISLKFSEIYGEVIMNNVMGLTTLLAIVWVNHLDWEYSAEVLIIFVTCVIIGFVAFLCNTYRLWTFILAFFLYFFSIYLYYVFNFYLGW